MSELDLEVRLSVQRVADTAEYLQEDLELTLEGSPKDRALLRLLTDEVGWNQHLEALSQELPDSLVGRAFTGTINAQEAMVLAESIDEALIHCGRTCDCAEAVERARKGAYAGSFGRDDAKLALGDLTRMLVLSTLPILYALASRAQRSGLVLDRLPAGLGRVVENLTRSLGYG